MEDLEDLRAAACELQAAFGQDPKERALLYAPESPDEWRLEIDPIEVDRLKRLESSLFPRLVRARFRLKLGFNLARRQITRRIVKEDSSDLLVIQPETEFPEATREFENVLHHYNELRRALRSTTPLGQILDLLNRADSLKEESEAPASEDSTARQSKATPAKATTVAQMLGVRLSLTLSLAKTADILPHLSVGVDEEAVHLLVFLFAESLAARLAATSFEGLESEYFLVGKRTAFLILGTRGRLEPRPGEAGSEGAEGWRRLPGLVAVYGWDEADGIAACGLSPEHRQTQRTAVEEILRFRNRHCLWPRGTGWLVPEAFEVRAPLGRSVEGLIPIQRALEELQVLLALIFLASETKRPEGGVRRFELLFGRGQREGVEVSPSIVAANKKHYREVLGLYEFAFRDRKVEKLDILRRTLQNWVHDATSLFESAGRALNAAEQIYENYLGGHVAEYFAARRQTQDYIHSVVRDMEASTVGLGASVAENVYKTVGVLAVAAVGGVLKPESAALLAAVGAAVIAGYVGLILAYYLPTVDRTWEIRHAQFQDHIRSFGDVLGKGRVENLVRNKRVRQAEAQFNKTRHQASLIYLVILALAVGAAVHFIT